jgi:predicted Zn-dependent peptidase
VAGKVNSNQIALINRHFGSDAWGTPNGVVACHHQLEPAADKKIFIPKPDAVQCAIRIGKATINKLHPDYQYLNVVNMILGGYFGSRLMSNIREEKGYTYGIGSGLVSYQKAGSFVIVSEVGKNVLPQALVEVYKEINKLRDDLVPNQELTLVKNYMMGGILRNFDGPFALLDSFRGLLEYNLEYDYLDNMINVVKSITPEQVRDIAQKYLDVNSLYEVVVG